MFSLVLAALAALLPASTAAAQNGAIQGIVYADRAPVDGAGVILHSADGPVARTRTAPDGTFAFANVVPGRYRVEAAKEGVGRGRADAGVRPGETVRVRIALANTENFGGVAGLTGNADGIVGEVNLVLSRNGREIARGMSNADGRFGFRMLAPGSYKINGAKRGVGRGETSFNVVAGQVTNIRVILVPEAPQVGSIVGQVVGANGPVAEAVVVLRNADREIARVMTDAEGRYGFRGLRPDLYGVSAFKRGEGEGATRVTVVAGQSVRAIIELRQPPQVGTLNGFTVNAAGAVAEANVSISLGGVVVARAVSGRDGSFSFPNLRPGHYVIEAAKRGVGAGRAEADVTAGGTTSIRVALR
jgi:protocatechuate 3,4-dioxygenase beta subunit